MCIRKIISRVQLHVAIQKLHELLFQGCGNLKLTVLESYLLEPPRLVVFVDNNFRDSTEFLKRDSSAF